MRNQKAKTGLMIGLGVVLAAALIVFAYFLIASKLSPATGSFYFSNDPSSLSKDAVMVESGVIKNYVTVYNDAVSTHYKDIMDDTEKYIYNAVAYATDNGYCCVYLPADICQKPELISDAVIKMSCDSPMLEHNFTENGTFYIEEVKRPDGVKLYHFELPRNTEKDKEKKVEAYNKAKEIVSAMPDDCDTDIEKAMYLYDFLTETVTYDEAFIGYDTVPIYDALIENKTICDGYADSLTMLFNLAGIDAFSVKGINDSKTGHVINIAVLDGQYYYFDSTADSAAAANGFDSRFYFAMDKATAVNYFAPVKQFEGLMPDSGEDLTGQFTVFVDEVNDATTEKIIGELEADGCVMMKFGESVTEEQQKQLCSEVAQKLDKSISHATYNGITGYVAA